MRQRQQAVNTTDAVVAELLTRDRWTDKELERRTQEIPFDVLLPLALQRAEPGSRRSRLQKRIIGGGMVIQGLLMVLLIVLMNILTPRQQLQAQFGLYFILLSVSCGMVMLITLARRSRTYNLLQLVELYRLELRPSHAGQLMTLLDMSFWPEDNIIYDRRRRLRLELVGLLSWLTETQCRALTEAQRTYLRSWLHKGTSQERVVALLVLGTAGDGASLPLAQALARDSEVQVQEAARDFLQSVESSHVSTNT